ncbi:MAG: N-acetylmuramoyl-L-alanine amidase [Candidatus Portnoybacteria bacterium]|nr:N-acetylmuramoyl-L-alanine amidase [Candidatus Portnoybacteria bacterium]
MKKLHQIFFLFLAAQGFLFLGIFGACAAENYYEDSGVPVILPRSTWDNSPSLNALMTWVPQNQQFPSDWQTIEHIIIHDTGCNASEASCNNNQNPIATIQSIYRYHAVTRGWGDIGYNYIIDQQGRIYEGRFGGNGSRGAHTYYDRAADNFNYGSIGISILGNYASQQPSAAVYESLGRLVGWLSASNNLDPSGSKSSLIWNADKGGFVSAFSGSVVLGHKNVEPGNPDPGMLDFEKVRQSALVYKQNYQSLVYQGAGSKIYQLAGGLRKIFESLGDFTAQGGAYQKLAAISQQQLDLFSENRFLKFPNGSLLQVSGVPQIYIIEDGKKRHLNITAAQFTKLGFDWGKILKVSESDILFYPSGLAVAYGPDKTLISDPAGKVFYIENGRKRWITSGQLFGVLKYKWSSVVKKTADFVAGILEGAPMSYPAGTLARGSSPAVYLIEKGEKREFISGQSFIQQGYQWKKVIQVADSELAIYPLGQFVGYKNGTLARAEGESAVWLLTDSQKKSFISAEQFENMGNDWKKVMIIPIGEISKYADTGQVQYPDGTLVQKKGDYNVYRVENGLAKLIPDAATFKKLKLSWAKVLKINTDDFGKLFASVASAIPQTPAPSQSQPPAVPSQPASGEPTLRVAIWEAPATQTEIIFTGSGPFDVYDKSGNLIASKQAGEQYSVSRSGFAKIKPKSGVLEIVSYRDLASWKTGLNYNKFRGNLELVASPKTGKVWVVNELALEEYLKGVAETNQGLNKEYLKTMSVAARTYAYHYWKLGGKYGSDEVYHITNTTSDQLYKGYGREPYASDIVDAATATQGEMAVYNGNPIVTAYSSGAAELITSGSKSACSVWGGKYCQAGYEYLAGGVKDPEGTTYSYSACGISGNHCVGLSGAGTRRLAELGKTYKEILTHYYPGITVAKIY